MTDHYLLSLSRMSRRGAESQAESISSVSRRRHKTCAIVFSPHNSVEASSESKFYEGNCDS